MAQPVPRLTALADALANAVTTNAQKTRLADAFVTHFRSEIEAADRDPDTLTNDERALLVLGKVKAYCRDIMRVSDAELAAARAAVAAAESEADEQARTVFPPEDTGIGAPMAGSVVR